MTTTGPNPLLVITSHDEDHLDLRHILGRDYQVYRAADRQEARLLVQRHRPAVVLCAEALPDGDWRGVLEDLEDAAGDTALMVFSSHADERLWSEVLHMGGWDVLTKPFEAGEVSRLTKIAEHSVAAA